MSVRVRKLMCRYMDDKEHAQDDSPLYIFDGSFAEKKGSRSMRHDYSIPSLFSEDLMRLGGEHRRPPYRYVPFKGKTGGGGGQLYRS